MPAAPREWGRVAVPLPSPILWSGHAGLRPLPPGAQRPVHGTDMQLTTVLRPRRTGMRLREQTWASCLDDRAGRRVGKGISSWGGCLGLGTKRGTAGGQPEPAPCTSRGRLHRRWGRQECGSRFRGVNPTAELSGQWAGRGGSREPLSRFSVGRRGTDAECHSFSRQIWGQASNAHGPARRK